MKTLRVLILSNVRPSRAWTFAKRILGEVPGAEICGIVQRPMRSIPWIQQMLAMGKRGASATPGRWSKAKLLVRSVTDKIADWLLWLAHGCPRRLSSSSFSVEWLRQECAQAGWLFALIAEDFEAGVAALLRPRKVDLVVLLGQFSSIAEFSARASMGCIWASDHKPSHGPVEPGRDALVSVEHLAQGAQTPLKIVSLTLPWQPFDGPAGFTLKADLIADDLLLETAGSLLRGDAATASTLVSQWANRVLTPLLSQLHGIGHQTCRDSRGRKRFRPTWKLCLDTLLLLSPGILVRNWHRRLSRRYPLLILAHHLVADRPHRMGVPTEVLWRQVLFLRKHYRIVGISEGVELLRSGQISAPTVVLTFDDGYADNFLNLRAVTNEIGIPPTLFVTTDPVEAHREFDHDLATGTTGFFPLTWDQIQYWNTRGVDFGSHTRTHFDCGSVHLEKLQSEILGSRNDLEARLGKPVEFFAFPYGKHKNMSSAAECLAASAYKHYVSCLGGESLAKAGQSHTHLFRKKFYRSQWELELELQSVFDLVDDIKAWFRRRASHSSKPAVVSPQPSSFRNLGAPPA
jgi:peptidoglycan/xylan/chitin deacetylase (PgdA/CDA1 family)